MTDQSTPPMLDPEFAERYRLLMQKWQAGEVSEDVARYSLENLLEEAQIEQNPMHEGSIELNIGILEGYLGHLIASAHHFEMARQQFERAGAKPQVITCDLNIGEVYRLQGNFTRAQMFFRRAYNDARALNVARTMATALTNEGQMWLSMGSIPRALDCLNEAIELCKSPFPDEDERLRQSRLGILAEVYHALAHISLLDDDTDSAWLLAKRAYEYGQETAQPMCIGFGNRAVADVITVLGASPDAAFDDNPDNYYRIALDHFRQLKMEGDVAKTLFARGNSLAKRGKRSAAAKLYQRSLAIFSKLGMSDDAAKVAAAQIRATT